MEQFKVAADLDVVHVAYRGIGPAITDILGGQTQVMFPGPRGRAAAHQGRQDAARSRSPALKRHPLLPDVPTFEELGYKGFDGVQWYGIVGPANLPAPIVKRLNDEINKAARRRPSCASGSPARRSSRCRCRPSSSASTCRDDIARWSKLAKERNIEITD